MGIDKNNIYPSTYNVLIEGVPAEEAVVHTRYGDVIPCNKGLFGSGVLLSKQRTVSSYSKKPCCCFRILMTFSLLTAPLFLSC
jgi:hypothetical protein